MPLVLASKRCCSLYFGLCNSNDACRNFVVMWIALVEEVIGTERFEVSFMRGRERQSRALVHALLMCVRYATDHPLKRSTS